MREILSAIEENPMGAIIAGVFIVLILGLLLAMVIDMQATRNETD